LNHRLIPAWEKNPMSIPAWEFQYPHTYFKANIASLVADENLDHTSASVSLSSLLDSAETPLVGS
jgi:hypothetical protein